MSESVLDNDIFEKIYTTRGLSIIDRLLTPLDSDSGEFDLLPHSMFAVLCAIGFCIEPHPCYSACPPGEVICTKKCRDQPWFVHDDGTIEDIPKSENRPCYSACPPWFTMCTLQCVDKPWYQQTQWLEKIESDPEFKAKAMEYLAPTDNQTENGPCYSPCPPWFTVCPRLCRDKPWYLQPEWTKKMEEDPEFKALALSYLPSLQRSSPQQNNRVCHSACPPWFTKCTRQCMDRPWYEQEKWIRMMEEDPEFKITAMSYIPAPLSTASESNQVCHSACPPWFATCTMQCMDKPWYQQEKWVKMMEEDKAFKIMAMSYIPAPLKTEANNRVCHSACPPWFTKCTRQCMDRPWYQQEKWIRMMEEDSDFKITAMSYIPAPLATSNSQQNNRVCHSACPPWFTKCTRQCMDKPWYEQEKWIQMMEEDPQFKTLALSYIPAPLKAVAPESNQVCHSACPPWFTTCTRQCMDKPWYEQEKWIQMMEQDPPFKTLAMSYIPRPLPFFPSENGRVCHSACPPWFKKCTKQCMDKPWYKQEKWVEMMEQDPDFRKEAISYIPPIAEQNRGTRSAKCYSACPPWFTRCDKSCKLVPWYEQETWVAMMDNDEEFYRKALKYMPTPKRSPAHNDTSKCPSLCPPWHKHCPDFCADRPWYRQPKWIAQMQHDPEFNKTARLYLSGSTDSDEKVEENGKCYSGCPPWFSVCTAQCMPEPWYKQARWAEMLRTDPDFKKQALLYLQQAEEPEPAVVQDEAMDGKLRGQELVRRDETKQCHSVCPPWETACIQICSPIPWYAQSQYARKLKEDPNFLKKAWSFLPAEVREQYKEAKVA